MLNSKYYIILFSKTYLSMIQTFSSKVFFLLLNIAFELALHFLTQLKCFFHLEK